METLSKDAENSESTNIIDTLPNDLLVRILMRLPIKDAIATMILSKRWVSVWTMLPILCYIDDSEDKRSVWQFLDKSLKLHKAPVLEAIRIELGPQCPVDEDVGKWITIAMTDRKVKVLVFSLKWSAQPVKLPYILYTCDTLVGLYLSHKILVDIVSPVCLPSLERLLLNSVVYKDEDSLVRLLSSCPILKFLNVVRNKEEEDNVKTFKVKVPSLETFLYLNVRKNRTEVLKGSLAIDSPALKTINITDTSKDFFSIENTPRLDQAVICCDPSDIKFMFSSLTFFDIVLYKAMVKHCTTINFSQLVECRIQPIDFDWLEHVMVLLHNSPKLKLLLIDQIFDYGSTIPFSWKCPFAVPKCVSTHLEIFEWKGYVGRNSEKEFIRYILANSRCLKRVAISVDATSNLHHRKKKMNLEDREKMMNDLKSMKRISQFSQFMDSPVILKEDYRMRVYEFNQIPHEKLL